MVKYRRRNEVAGRWLSSMGVAAAVLQPDGRIVAIGWRMSFLPFGGNRGHLVLARYNQDGTIDDGFGNAGKALVEDVTANGIFNASGVLQPDGKIVVADSAFNVIRFNTDGAFDLGFGVAGTASAPASFSPKTVALQSNGKIVVGGFASPNYPNPEREFAAIRLNRMEAWIPLSGQAANSIRRSARFRRSRGVATGRASSPTAAESPC